MMWTALYMTKKKNQTQKIMQKMAFLAGIHYAAQAVNISPDTDYYIMCIMDIIDLPLLLLLMSFLLTYILVHTTKHVLTDARKTWVFLPSMIFAPLLFAVYYMFGIDNAIEYFKISDKYQAYSLTDSMLNEFAGTAETSVLKAFELVDVMTFNILAAIYCLIIVAQCVLITFRNGYKFGDIIRFWLNGHEIPFTRAVSFCCILLIIATSPILFLGRSYMINHASFGILMSLSETIAIFFFAYIETLSNEKTLSLKKCLSRAFSEVSVIEIENETEKSSAEAKEALAIIRTRSLTEKIRIAFEEEKIYKDPELSLAVLSEMLNINRTTLSNTINQQYGLSFREMLNNYRINAAKEYLQQNPSATQLEIAVACGFKSASAFNHKFKELTGETPSNWLLSNASGVNDAKG